MMKKALFRYIEAELYDYHKTKKDLESLRAEIIESGQELYHPDDEGIHPQNRISDPTGEKTMKLLTNRRITKMTETIRAIDKVYSRLEKDKQKLVELKYWTHRSGKTGNDVIALELGVSDATFYRWRSDVVSAVAIELGMMDISEAS